MANLLVVPVVLDALVLEQAASVVEAFADFSRLPYFNGETDINPNTPNLSEEILSQPFQNQNLYLAPGIHLHWAIPDALTQGVQGVDGSVRFPAVPNRWLVTRKWGADRIDQWVVESDYFCSPANSSNFEAAGQAGIAAGVAYPYVESQYQPPAHVQPFRYGYLGRVTPAAAWDPAQAKPADYLNKLTAVGYGEPAFAAFYPNCYSVFGFHDPNGDAPQDLINQLNSVTYEVLGWYADPGQDYLPNWLFSWVFNWLKNAKDPGHTFALVQEQLQALQDAGRLSDPASTSLRQALAAYDRLSRPVLTALTQALAAPSAGSLPVLTPIRQALEAAAPAMTPALERLRQGLDEFDQRFLSASAELSQVMQDSAPASLPVLKALRSALRTMDAISSTVLMMLQQALKAPEPVSAAVLQALQQAQKEAEPAGIPVLADTRLALKQCDHASRSLLEALQAALEACDQVSLPVLQTQLRELVDADLLNTPVLEALRKAIEKSPAWSIPALEEQRQALEAATPLSPASTVHALPLQMVCYAQIEFCPPQGDGNGKLQLSVSPSRSQAVQAAIGNTTTEALSAYLAHQWDANLSALLAEQPASGLQDILQALLDAEKAAAAPGQPAKSKKSIIEDQLEALHLASGLEKHRLDIGAKFREARHTQGFRSAPAGSIWTLRPESEPGPRPDGQRGASNQEQATLDLDLAARLNALNDLQQAYDQAQHEITSLRQQLFADWYKYMLSAYPPLDTPIDYPNIDEVKQFISGQDLPPLIRKLQAVGKLHIRKQDAAGQPIPASDAHPLAPILSLLEPAGSQVFLKDDLTCQTVLNFPPAASLAERLVQAINDLLDSDALCSIQQVAAGDIRDWAGFLPALAQAGELKLDPQLFQAGAGNGSGDPQGQILAALNQRIFSRNFYQAFDAANIPGRSAAGKLLKQLAKAAQAPRHMWVRINRLLLEALFPEHIAHRPNYILRQTPAPRYWEPNEPVVLLAGEAVKPTHRHGAASHFYRNGLLDCRVAAAEPGPAEFAAVSAAASAAVAALDPPIQPNQWQQQPWNPILLEWEAEYFPVQDGAGASTGASTGASASASASANVYTGRSILTPHAKKQLKKRLEEFLAHLTLEDCYPRHTAVDAQWVKDVLTPWYAQKYQTYPLPVTADTAWCDEMIAWYAEKPQPPAQSQPSATVQAPSPHKDPIYTTLLAYRMLLKTHVLAQSLGGFNQALLMHKQTLQLPIHDPLGFADYREFTQVVKLLVGSSSRSAPQPSNDFNPIRSGEMQLLQLRVIDSFGQVLDVACSDLAAAETLPPHLGRVSLPARLSQPARLNFRWLAAAPAGGDEVEMNDHPATSPICGWVLPNNLDSSLMVYDQSGQALGSLDRKGWRPAPGRLPISIAEIANPHLRQVVDYLLQQPADPRKPTPGYLDRFLNVIEKALEQIDPDNFNHNQALALLMGRPIAVVRARLNLELSGRPAVQQSWTAFRQDMQATATRADAQGIQHLERTSDGFTKVPFPLRIGEHRRLNDGLVGYWVEAGDGFSQQGFIHQVRQPAQLEQCIDDAPLTLTLLIDPRAALHASCDILPTKAISLPPDQFAEALRTIEVTFLTAPVLTEVNQIKQPLPGAAQIGLRQPQQTQIKLPLPEEPGYQWSWIDGVWTAPPEIVPTDAQAGFAARQEIREGWLALHSKPDV